MDELQFGSLFRFADWPVDDVPRRAAGIYTIWRRDEFIYVGMSARGAAQEDFAQPGTQNKSIGLWTRLNSHASGRRSGDQFNVYICDRFIVPGLESDEQMRIGRGELSLDQMTKAFIREHLSFRFLTSQDGNQALTIEREIRAGSLPAGRPYLNPL